MDEISQLAHQTGIGVMAVYLLQWLKQTAWVPFITEHSATLNKWLGVLIAVATSVGIKYAVSQGAGAYAGGYHVVLDIPSAQTLFDTAIHAAAQFAGQQILYHTAVKETVGGLHVATVEGSGTVQGQTVSVATSEPKTVAGDKKD